MAEALVTPKDLGIPEMIPLPKRKDWRIGIVGFGGVARGGHAPAYREAGWTMAAAADTNLQALTAARAEFGIVRTYGDYRDLIADESVEVIDLLTQPIVREEVIRAAAAAGKPIITEKPFAQTAEECVRMVDAAGRAGIALAVHQNYRWMKMNFYAHHIVRQGLIGEPFYASIEIQGTQDVHLATHPFYATCDNFLTIQWNNHLTDLLRYWTGRDAIRVLARTGRMNGQNFRSDNLLLSIADFGEGLTGHIVHSELLRSDLGGVQCRVDGSKGSIVFDFHDALRIESSEVGKGVHRLAAPTSTWGGSFAGSMGDFLIALEEGHEPQVSGRRNLATIRTILAEDRSVRAGGIWMPCE